MHSETWKTLGDFSSSMGDNSEDSPIQRARKELRVGPWKGKILIQECILVIQENILIIFLNSVLAQLQMFIPPVKCPRSLTLWLDPYILLNHVSGYSWHCEKNGQKCSTGKHWCLTEYLEVNPSMRISCFEQQHLPTD